MVTHKQIDHLAAALAMSNAKLRDRDRTIKALQEKVKELAERSEP